MKKLFTALMAVFFMFAINGCGDDAETETTTDVVEVEVSEDAGVSQDAETSADVSEGEGDDASDPADTDGSDSTAEGEDE